MNTKLLITIAVVFVVLGLVVWWWRKTGTPVALLPELPAVEVKPVVPQPGAVRYTLQASLPEVERLPVYHWTTDRGNPSKWAGALGFAGEPQEVEDALEGTLYLWSQEGETLVISEDASSLSYRVDLKSNPETLRGSFLPNFEQAAAIVERTLEEFGDVSGLLTYDPTKNKALKVGVEYVNETALEQAELVEIHLVAKVDDYSVYLGSGPEQDPVLAWVGRDGKLLRLEYHPLGALGEKISDYPLKNPTEILQDLDSGKGVVVSSNLEGGEEIVSITITKTDLGYLLPQPEATIIQPIFVLTGSARTASGKSGAITVYLPAVD